MAGYLDKFSRHVKTIKRYIRQNIKIPKQKIDTFADLISVETWVISASHKHCASKVELFYIQKVNRVVGQSDILPFVFFSDIYEEFHDLYFVDPN